MAVVVVVVVLEVVVTEHELKARANGLEKSFVPSICTLPGCLTEMHLMAL